MADKITSNPEPVNTAVPQAPEVPIPAVTEPATPIQTEIPTESESVAEPATAQMGGNEPLAEPVQVETEPIPAQPTTPETLEVIAPTEATSEVQVEALVLSPVSEPVATSAPAPAQVVASVVTPVVAPIITKTFTKSIRELFTKALGARQNRKRKKLDRILSLFAKQTMLTNNEVENLLHISDSTATRYLATLTKEGKLKQNTKKGHAVSYSKI